MTHHYDDDREGYQAGEGELKPCPFCGRTPESITAEGRTKPTVVYCSCSTKDGPEFWPIPVFRWNHRPLEDALRAERDQLRRERDEAREQAGEYRKDIAMIGARANDLERESPPMRIISIMALDALKRRTPPPSDDGAKGE